MLSASWSTFRDRWQVFAGAIITVCLGVGLVQSSPLTLVSSATAKIPSGLPKAERRALQDRYASADTLLGMELGLAAFIAVFIVGTTFAFTVEQRRRDLALLRLTGASRGQVRTLLLGEAFLLGTVGSGLGILVGLPLMRMQAWMLTEFAFVPPGFSAQWRSWIIFVGVGTGVGVSLLGVLTASARASKLRPLEALRDSGRPARTMTPSRWIIGTLPLAGGIAMLTMVPHLGTEQAKRMSTLVSMVLVIAFAALAPLLAQLVGGLLTPVLRGRLGQLAQANLRDGVRRSAATAAPIMVFVAFVAGWTGAQATLTEAGRQEITRNLRGDFVVAADRPIAAELATVDGADEAALASRLASPTGVGEVMTAAEWAHRYAGSGQHENTKIILTLAVRP
ncbi:MAG: ABC transporter permease [Dactylosporangium sp.]|nr:ABC transporter permease [Dactylosporangium sp.]NNJ63273.1 ABC transporter permease [Dactylosporangium sp.]